MDLADPASIARAFEAIGKRIAATTYEKAVLINNAGVIEPVAPLDRADPGDIEHNLAVNLVAPMLLMRYSRCDRAVKLRRVINISSGRRTSSHVRMVGLLRRQGGARHGHAGGGARGAGGLAIEAVSLARA